MGGWVVVREWLAGEKVVGKVRERVLVSCCIRWSRVRVEGGGGRERVRMERAEWAHVGGYARERVGRGDGVCWIRGETWANLRVGEGDGVMERRA